MATQRERREKTRRALIDAALVLSAEQGYAGLSLREVTRRAGVSPAAFYGHFADMEDLGLALMDEVGMTLRRVMREVRRRQAPDRSVVRASVDALMGFLDENAHQFRLLLAERSGSSAVLRRATQREVRYLVDELAADMHHAAAALDRPAADTHVVAEMVVMIVIGGGAEALDRPECDRGELAERMIKKIRLVLLGAEAAAAGWQAAWREPQRRSA